MITMTPTQQKAYISELLWRHMDSIEPTDKDYLIFIQNRIIALSPQTVDGLGRREKLPYIYHIAHPSIVPQLWKRYQFFLLKQYHDEWTPSEVKDRLDSMIAKSYKKVGKYYNRCNKYYQKIKEYQSRINNK